MFDLVGGPPHFQAPLAKGPFHLDGFQLLVKELNLGGDGLVLLVQGMIAVDFSHVAPVVLGEGFEPLPEGGECGRPSSEGSQEPPGEALQHVILPPRVDGRIQIGDDGEIGGGVPFGVGGHPSTIHVPDPLGRASHTVPTGEVDADLSAVFDVPRRGFLEWLGILGGGVCKGGPLLFYGLLLLVEESLEVVEVVSMFNGEGEAVDKFLKKVQVDGGVIGDDVVDWLQR